jgi:hypothetical protein
MCNLKYVFINIYQNIQCKGVGFCAFTLIGRGVKAKQT